MAKNIAINGEGISQLKIEEIGFKLLLVHLYLEYTRLPSLLPALAPLALPAIAGYACTAAWLAANPSSALRVRAVKVMILLLVLMALHVPIAKNNYFAFKYFEGFAQILFTTVIPILTFVKTEFQRRKFIHHFIIVNILVAIYVITHGGIGPGGFLADENDVALALVVAVPFALTAALEKTSTKRMRALMFAGFSLLLVAIIVSKSRGGFLGLTGTLIVLWSFARHRLRIMLIIAASTIVIGGGILSALPKGYVADLISATDPEDGTRRERIYSWTLSWRMYVDNPIIGVGQGNYAWRVNDYEAALKDSEHQGHKSVSGRQAHSLYFTVLPELGTFGAICFLFTAFSAIQKLRRTSKFVLSGRAELKTSGSKIQKSVGADPEASPQSQYSRSVLAALAGFLISAAFISVLYYPHYWQLLALSALAGGIASGNNMSRNRGLSEFKDSH